MPRIYKCKKCGIQHGPPTGKQCTNERQVVENNPMQELLPVLMDIRSEMARMNDKMQPGEAAGRSETIEQEEIAEESEISEEEEEAQTEGASGGRQISPKTLRRDVRAMRKAAERIARYQDSDSDDEDRDELKGTKKKGKKSGSVMKAADDVETRIDWPHMYVQRVEAGQRTGVDYKQLRIDEFVYGFIAMLKAKKCRWDKELMIDILQMLMQDSMDFAWENARSFYELVGIDVEKGVRKWTDADGIRDMRLLHSRTHLTDKPKEVPVIKKNNGGRATSAATKCCALYQRHSCEHNRDHPPFSHGCVYCQRVTGMFFRHPEADCYRKAHEESKNGVKRE